jgi:hypothetical protein
LEKNELNNEDAMMLLIMALMEENKRNKIKINIVLGLITLGGILYLWK